MSSQELKQKIETSIFVGCYVLSILIALFLTEINLENITLHTARYFLDNFIFVISLFLIPSLLYGLNKLYAAILRKADLNTMIHDIKLTIFFGYQVLFSISWYFFFYK